VELTFCTYTDRRFKEIQKTTTAIPLVIRGSLFCERNTSKSRRPRWNDTKER